MLKIDQKYAGEVSPYILDALRAAEAAAKPRLRRVPGSGWSRSGGGYDATFDAWYECTSPDRRGIGRTPAAAYRSWLAAAQWGVA